MQKFIRQLFRLSGNEKQLRKWENVSTGQAFRALFLGLASLVSVIIGVSVQALTSSYAIGTLAMTVSLPILFPLSIILLDKFQKRILNTSNKPELLNQRKILEYEYDDALRRLENLNLPEEKKAELRVELYRDFQKRLDELDKKFLE